MKHTLMRLDPLREVVQPVATPSVSAEQGPRAARLPHDTLSRLIPTIDFCTTACIKPPKTMCWTSLLLNIPAERKEWTSVPVQTVPLLSLFALNSRQRQFKLTIHAQNLLISLLEGLASLYQKVLCSPKREPTKPVKDPFVQGIGV